jgi:hypothetical protein
MPGLTCDILSPKQFLRASPFLLKDCELDPGVEIVAGL